MDDALSSGQLAARRMVALGLRRPTAVGPRQAVSRLVAVQAQEHRVARWSVAQRLVEAASASEMDRAFDRGELLRTHVLRPTWHYVAPEDLRWLMRFSGPKVTARTARYFNQFGFDAPVLARTTDIIADAVREGPKTRPELGRALARQGFPGAGPELASMVMHAELHLAVCSGPMRGAQHTYAAFDDRVRGDGPSGDEALAELARRYFTTRGPATATDFAWWAGLRAGEARLGLDLAAEHLEFHEVDGRPYAFADHGEVAEVEWVDFVQCYDEAIVSYRDSRDLLKTGEVDFDPPRRVDGFAHVILRNGQLLGHWRLASSKTEVAVETRLAVDVPTSTARAVRDAADVLRRFLNT